MNISITSNQFDQWMENRSDALNPILVRETRQALNSRQFAGTFLVTLCIAWILSVLFGIGLGSAMNETSAGIVFFHMYSLILSFCLFFIVPAGMFWNMSSEFQQNTLEVLVVTPLTAPRILFGKLQSGIVQMMVYYSTLAPFICLTYLLGGIGLIGIGLYLIISFAVSLALCLGAVMLGSLSHKTHWSSVNLLLLLAGSFIMFLIFMNLADIGQIDAFSTSAFGALLTGLTCFGFFFFILFSITFGVATDRLTPVSSYLRPIDAGSSLSSSHTRSESR